MVRGSLVGLIHTKILLRRGVDARTENEKAIPLINTDIDSLGGVAEMFHESWAQLIEVIVGLTLLSQRIGWVSPVLLLSIFGKKPPRIR